MLKLYVNFRTLYKDTYFLYDMEHIYGLATYFSPINVLKLNMFVYAEPTNGCWGNTHSLQQQTQWISKCGFHHQSNQWCGTVK